MGDGTLTNCTFTGNSADRGGGFSGNGILTNCSFKNNHAADKGGAMLNFYSTDSILINCSFSNNSAGKWGGGMVNIEDACATLFNCIFYGNTAGYGGGIFNYSFDDSGGLNLINCTLSDNSAAVNAGGIFNDASTPIFTNSILWGNSDSGGQDFYAQIYNDRGGSAIIEYCCIQGWTGYHGYAGTIASDPCFVNPANGDYHLREASLCIDAGDPNYIAEPNETDLDGRPRVIGGRIDMGAYEYRPTIPAEVRIVPRTINLTSMGKWITCYISLPEDYNVADIDPNNVILEYEIQPESLRLDEEQQVVIAKFSRSDVQGILSIGQIELSITGQLTDGTVFEGTDVIRVKDKGGKNIESVRSGPGRHRTRNNE